MWVKRLFIDRQFKTNSDNPEENENPDDYSFIFASVTDNTVLMNSESGKSYLNMLSALPEKLRKAHRYGDWDAMSGTYFDEFSEARHVVKPFQIPSAWQRYRAFDYGLDMFACYWVAVAPNGRCYFYREFCQSNMIVADAAKAALERTMPGENISITFAPPDIWNRQKDSGKSMAEVFMLSGVGLVKASNNRIQGHLQVKELLADMEDGKPGLLIFDTCKELIKGLTYIQADENNPSDCAKQPHEITHSVDACRYFCVSRVLSEPEAETFVEQEEEIDETDYEDAMTGGSVDASYLDY